MRNVRAHFLKFADPYSAVVDKTRGKYDWSAVDRNLAAAAKRGRHSVTTVPRGFTYSIPAHTHTHTHTLG